MSQPDHFDLTDTEQELGALSFNVAYPATYLVLLFYTGDGYGGRSGIRLRDETGASYCMMTHTSDKPSSVSGTCMFELPAGDHTFRPMAVNTSPDVGQEVRSNTEAIFVPISQAP